MPGAGLGRLSCLWFSICRIFVVNLWTEWIWHCGVPYHLILAHRSAFRFNRVSDDTAYRGYVGQVVAVEILGYPVDAFLTAYPQTKASRNSVAAMATRRSQEEWVSEYFQALYDLRLEDRLKFNPMP